MFTLKFVFTHPRTKVKKAKFVLTQGIFFGPGYSMPALICGLEIALLTSTGYVDKETVSKKCKSISVTVYFDPK